MKKKKKKKDVLQMKASEETSGFLLFDLCHIQRKDFKVVISRMIVCYFVSSHGTKCSGLQRFLLRCVLGFFFPSRQLSFKTVSAPSFVFFRCVFRQIRRKAPARGKYPAPRKKAGGVTLCAAALLSRLLEDICLIYTEKNKMCFSGGEVSLFVLFCCGTMKLSWENVRSIKDELTHMLSVSLCGG